METLAAMLYLALGAANDGQPVCTDMVLRFTEGVLTPDQIRAGMELYESLFDIGKL